MSRTLLAVIGPWPPARAVTAGWYAVAAAAMRGRCQITRLPASAVTRPAAAAPMSATALLPREPSESNLVLVSGTRNVRPRSLFPSRIVLDFQVIAAPLGAEYAPEPMPTRGVTGEDDHAPVSAPVVSSMRSPVSSTSRVTSAGK